MPDNVNALLSLATKPSDYTLLYDALRFAIDDFTDENGLRWSNDEYSRLQELIAQLEKLLPVDPEE
jgi:hypothetical protein